MLITQAYLASLEKTFGCRLDNERLGETFLANDAKALLAANSSEWFNYCDYAKCIKAPSLIYAGAKEPSVAELRQLSGQLPDCQIHILPDIDHKQAYWYSELVAPLIRDFLARVR